MSSRDLYSTAAAEMRRETDDGLAPARIDAVARRLRHARKVAPRRVRRLVALGLFAAAAAAVLVILSPGLPRERVTDPEAATQRRVDGLKPKAPGRLSAS